MTRKDRLITGFGVALCYLAFLMLGIIVGMVIMISVAGAPIPINAFYALPAVVVMFFAGRMCAANGRE